MQTTKSKTGESRPSITLYFTVHLQNHAEDLLKIWSESTDLFTYHSLEGIVKLYTWLIKCKYRYTYKYES